MKVYSILFSTLLLLGSIPATVCELGFSKITSEDSIKCTVSSADRSASCEATGLFTLQRLY